MVKITSIRHPKGTRRRWRFFSSFRTSYFFEFWFKKLDVWSGRRGLNPLPPRWQRDALPNELHPHRKIRRLLFTPAEALSYELFPKMARVADHILLRSYDTEIHVRLGGDGVILRFQSKTAGK